MNKIIAGMLGFKEFVSDVPILIHTKRCNKE